MKKLSLFGLCLAVAVTASAQMSLVKDAKKSFKPGGDYNAFVEMITPAFTNPETAQLAETWFTAGEAGFDNYDYYMSQLRAGGGYDAQAMGSSLVKGYELIMQALPFDSIPNEKGKVKPKYSKDIAKLVSSHHDAFNTAGALLWEAQDYPGAYEAWGIYLNIPNDQRLGKGRPAALPDSVVAMTNYNRGLAAFQARNYQDALDAFDMAIAYNYDDPQIYEFAAEMARQLNLPERQLELAQKGYAATGDPKYMRVLVNYYIDKNDFAKATELLDNAIASTPDSPEAAMLYVLRGSILEYTDEEAQTGNGPVVEYYKKAIELNPEYGAGYYNYGRTLFNKAATLDQAIGNVSEAEYAKFVNETRNPILLEAAKYLEKGYTLDNSFSQALNLLQQIYYQVGDEENLERVKGL